MTKSEYNGWTNYETWNVKLWIDNDEGSYRYWQDKADAALEANTETETNDAGEDVEEFDLEAAACDLARDLEHEIEDNAPDLGASCYADLLNAALREVNWNEIASSLIDEAKERATE